MQLRKSRQIFHFWAFLFFLAITLAITWPLVVHLTDRVAGWYIADNYEYLWKMWWFKHAIVDLQQSPLVAPRILYPYGYPLAYSELTLLHTLVGLPFTWLWGEIPTYNLFAFLSFVLSGWATFGFLHQLGINFWPALFGGVLFMLTPYHVERYGGILPLMSVEGIPIFLWGIEGWIKNRKNKWALFAGLGFIVAGWASMYYAFGLALLGFLYIGVRLWPLFHSLRERNTRWGLAIIGLISVFGATLAMLPHWQLNEKISLRIPLGETDYWSASPSDYLIPPGLHPLWGEWVRDHLLGVPQDFSSIGLEFVLGVGYVCLLFAVYGWRRSQIPAKRAILWFTVSALLLSLGPRLHLGRYPIVILAPDQIVETFHRVMDVLGMILPTHETYSALEEAGLSVPLPALLLRWLLPPLAGMRAWNRFAAFASLGLALLAGIGMDVWLQDEVYSKERVLSGRVMLSIMVVLGVALFELWPVRIPLQPIGPRAVDLWLASQPDDFTIMELPLTSALSGPQMLYTRYHQKKIAFAAGYLPYWYREQFPELLECPENACLDRLLSWDVHYILLNREAMTGENSGLEVALDASSALRRVGNFDQIVVYRLELAE